MLNRASDYTFVVNEHTVRNGIEFERLGAFEFGSLNRLTIVIALEYIDHKNDDNSWKSNFSHFVNFPANQDITGIQDDLIDEIKDQLMEDIFNKAFTNW